ncbi:MAG: TspO/MBR family protein [Kiritimatiellia bacterium]|nr:TspO/MBR family protein [Kiritimatiellia bacterium]
MSAWNRYPVVQPARSAVLSFFGFSAWVVLTFVAAALGGAASAQAGAFYGLLAQPSWAPPGWLFGPVWSVLYALMGVSAGLVWRKRGLRGARFALGLYLVQLAANALWSWLFFAWRLGAIAFVEILVLWVLVLATLLVFRKIRPIAGWLLLPYLAWITFAAALAHAVWKLNPALLG